MSPGPQGPSPGPGPAGFDAGSRRIRASGPGPWGAQDGPPEAPDTPIWAYSEVGLSEV